MKRDLQRWLHKTKVPKELKEPGTQHLKQSFISLLGANSQAHVPVPGRRAEFLRVATGAEGPEGSGVPSQHAAGRASRGEGAVPN